MTVWRAYAHLPYAHLPYAHVPYAHVPCRRAALHDRMESLCVEKERLDYERAFAHTAMERAQSALARLSPESDEISIRSGLGLEAALGERDECPPSSFSMSSHRPASSLDGSAQRQVRMRLDADRLSLEGSLEGSAVAACAAWM